MWTAPAPFYCISQRFPPCLKSPLHPQTDERAGGNCEIFSKPPSFSTTPCCCYHYLYFQFTSIPFPVWVYRVESSVAFSLGRRSYISRISQNGIMLTSLMEVIIRLKLSRNLNKVLWQELAVFQPVRVIDIDNICNLSNGTLVYTNQRLIDDDGGYSNGKEG